MMQMQMQMQTSSYIDPASACIDLFWLPSPGLAVSATSLQLFWIVVQMPDQGVHSVQSAQTPLISLCMASKTKATHHIFQRSQEYHGLHAHWNMQCVEQGIQMAVRKACKSASEAWNIVLLYEHCALSSR